MTLEVKCRDFLAENRHVYAVKARRKKIAIIRIDVTNGHPSEVRLLLGASKLTSGGKSYNVERPAVVIRKLTEFTWDFLLFAVIDFHPVTAAIEAFFFLIGPIYNWRLRSQLSLMSDGEMALSPGQRQTALLAFRGVSKEIERLTISYRPDDGEEQQVDYDLDGA